MQTTEMAKNWLDSFLLKIGLRPKYLGFKQLKDVVIVRLRNSSRLVTGEIYETVSVMYKTTPSAVERNIRTAIHNAFINDTLIRINKVLDIDVMDKNYCLTNCELISLITEYVDKIKKLS